ncbi:MAG: ATP-binding protein [Anaerolineae bacterium]|nr:MAG: ATP-binding protein [Anaerolineae bacterium]
MAKVFKTARRVFAGRYESLNEIREFIAEAAQEAQFDSQSIYAMQLAVDEACCNIIDHAYGGEDRGWIDCQVDVRSDGLLVTLIDQGKSFDPEQVPPPQIGKPLKEVKPRGVGLYLIKKMVDKMEYHSVAGQGNVMRLFKRKR